MTKFDVPARPAIRLAEGPLPRPATGDQYLLRRGTATARIGQVGAVLREFTDSGTHYTETWPEADATPYSCGLVLLPWPNRVAAGVWHWAGLRQQLDITEPQRGNALHGLVNQRPHDVIAQTDDSVTLAATIYPQHGWPFALDTAVTYAVTDQGLAVTHHVRNIGADHAVFGCGAHPYLRVGDVPVDDLTVTVRAGSYYVTDDAMIPVEKRPVDGRLAQLPTGVRVGELHLDTGLTDLALVRGRIEHELTAPDGRGLTVWADPDFAYTIVFTPDDFPNDTSRGPTGLHRAIAIEPMTCPTNALASGEALIRLAPGEAWQGSWGISPHTQARHEAGSITSPDS